MRLTSRATAFLPLAFLALALVAPGPRDAVGGGFPPAGDSPAAFQPTRTGSAEGEPAPSPPAEFETPHSQTHEGQSRRGSGGVIRGRVRARRDGAPLAGATVQLVGLARGVHADSVGAFALTGLPPGAYEVLVTHIGFEPARQGVTLGERASAAPHLDVRLKTSSVGLSGVVVTAARRPQSLARSPLSIAVAQGADLTSRNAFTLASAIKQVPGVSQVGSHVNIRGSSGFSRGVGSRVLLLLDGTPLLSADSGEIKWDVIPPGQVERVEVVKGAGSALYGTGALGGVINVITRTPAAAPETRWQLVSGLYSQPAHEAWRWRDDPMWLAGVDVSHSRTAGGLGLVLAAGHHRTTGYEENDDFRRYNAYARLGAALSERTTWSGLVSWALDDHGTFLQWRSRTEPLRVPDGDATAATTSWKLAAHTVLNHLYSYRTSARLKAYYYLTDVDNSRAAGDFATTGHRLGAELNVDHQVGPDLRLTAGAVAAVDAVRSAADFAGRRSAHTLAAFGQATAQLSPAVELALGCRLDLHGRDPEGSSGTRLCPAAPGLSSRWDGQVSPQLGLAYSPRTGTDLRASLGRGFRAPSIIEAHAQASASGVLVCPNPAITPEKSWSGELGLRQRLGRAMAVDVALFWNEYDDLVEARPQPDLDGAAPRASFRNLSEARVRGVELEHRAALLGGVLWRGAYTWLDAAEFPRAGEVQAPYCSEGLTPGESAPLPYRARHQASGEVRGPVGSVSAGLSLRYVSRFERVSGLFAECRRDFLPVYLVDVFAARRVGPVRIQVRIDNLFQYHYVLVERELRPLRRLSLSLSGTL